MSNTLDDLLGKLSPKQVIQLKSCASFEELEKQVNTGAIELSTEELEDLRGILLGNIGPLCDEELDMVSGGGSVMAGTATKIIWPWG